jgi:hypothetical protein
MTIEGVIERCNKSVLMDGTELYMVWTKGRAFITEDSEVGSNCMANKGMYGLFTYQRFKDTPNKYYLESWRKL